MMLDYRDIRTDSDCIQDSTIMPRRSSAKTLISRYPEGHTSLPGERVGYKLVTLSIDYSQREKVVDGVTSIKLPGQRRKLTCFV